MRCSVFSCHALGRAKITRLRRDWGWNTEVKGIIRFKLNFGMSSALRMKLGRGLGNSRLGRISFDSFFVLQNLSLMCLWVGEALIKMAKTVIINQHECKTVLCLNFYNYVGWIMFFFIQIVLHSKLFCCNWCFTSLCRCTTIHCVQNNLSHNMTQLHCV